MRFFEHAVELAKGLAIALAIAEYRAGYPDDPFWDATDGAHPAWWRGQDYGFQKGRMRGLRAGVALAKERVRVGVKPLGAGAYWDWSDVDAEVERIEREREWAANDVHGQRRA
jgi:hypothetical protein